MSDDIGEFQLVDMTEAIRRVGDFIGPSTMEEKIAVVAWATWWLDQLSPEVRAGVMIGAANVNNVLESKRPGGPPEGLQ